VIGPEAVVPWPHYTDKLDHELELAAVIGTAGRDIPRERALDHVFGYTLWNDLSARDVQTRELPIGMGPGKAKDWDGSNVLGPCIVTSDELDVSDLRLEVRVNGERWGGDTTANMQHTFADLIAYASLAETLHPGDVLGSGTATGGSGIELDRWIRPGDVVELQAEGVGVLRNTIGPKGE
jgi:2-keto-4-pentenoate hydratase/2-oxohepta-3-ene-1,7-dioic acid hydratase in catechol pathway